MFKIIFRQITILAIFIALFLPAFSQNSQVYNDVAPFSGSKALRKFSIGINGGVLNPSVIFGGSNDFANPKYTLGYGANIRYQFNHYLAIQGDFLLGKLRGDQDSKFGVGRPVSSFRTDLDWVGTLSGVITIGNINWLSTKNKVIPYVSAGIGFMGYDTKIVNAGTTNEIDYVDNISPDNPVVVPVGVGLKFNLSRVINLDLGYRMNFVDADNLDGLPYWNSPTRFLSRVHKDKFSYGFLGLEFALGDKNKPQMLFDNPVARLNNTLQKQIDTVKANQDQMMMDSDNDGVVDKFDKEPNTPAGCPVDVHGVSRDTDGDGVPDCKDKELVTPTQCQPVDADGVGKCPDPECCKNMVQANMNACSVGDLPSISFQGNRSSLSSDAKAMLATVGSKLKASAECSISVTGYPAASKASQALCNKRVELIKSYLTETEGISADRIEVNCEVGGGDSNTVDIKSK
ncbi:MAG: DUF6089 family protein [Ginsengibacter sp.]